MTILFVNACVRGAESETLKLCKSALETLGKKYPEATIKEVNLMLDNPQGLTAETLEKRNTLRAAGDYSDPMFDYAKDFAAADKIIIGAPYWDLSFPAILKIYFEQICVVDITFMYTEDGHPKGLCKADELLYISTVGGPLIPGFNMGFDYVKALCTAFYGIENVDYFMIDMMEVFPNKAERIENAKLELAEKLK